MAYIYYEIEDYSTAKAIALQYSETDIKMETLKAAIDFKE